MNILVIGGSGFIGSHLVRILSGSGHSIFATYRSNKPDLENVQWRRFDIARPAADYKRLTENMDTVIHLASIAHDVNGQHLADTYTKINVDGTRSILQGCSDNKIRRFIYLSSSKVLGNGGQGIPVFTDETSPVPDGIYGETKLQAEKLIEQHCQQEGIDFVILRPPLVYGPCVKANFLKLIQLVMRQVPLPFASIKNKRSFIYVENLCHAINACIESKRTINSAFLVSDSEISTPDLIKKIAQQANKRAVLLPVPPALLTGLATLFNKQSSLGRLTDSFVVDSSRFRQLLNWQPPISMQAGLKSTVNWYLDR